MLEKLRSRLTFANVISVIALFVALGGSSYAALTITGRNVKNASLTGADIKDRSLLSRHFRRGQLPGGAQGPKGDPGAQGQKGDTGPKGDNGPQGQKGDTGTPEISGLEEVNGVSASDSVSPKAAEARCPAGKRVIGGGAFVNALLVNAPIALKSSVPSAGDGSRWHVTAYETADYPGDWNVNARALCAKVAP